jgi:hypothetical protein
MVIDKMVALPQNPTKHRICATSMLTADQIEVPAPVLAARIDMIVHAQLSPLGFERIRPRFWVEGQGPPIRRLFEFQALKGASYSARWGFSLDFVPIQRSSRLQWKRTAKTASFDLCIDPIDQAGEVPDSWYVSRFIFPLKSYDWSKFTRTVKNATLVAQPDFSRIISIGDIVAIFNERSAMKFRRFSLENYIQTHLAWGLCLMAIGEAEEGERHLEKYCDRFSVDRTDRIICEAEREAKRIAIG